MRRTSPLLVVALALGLGLAVVGVALAAPDLDPEAEAARKLPGPFQFVRVVDFDGEIGSLLAAYVTRQLADAKDDGVDCLVLRIESPGGTVLHSLEISDGLMDLPDTIHTLAWIPKEAYSGAAMVALACDEIVMGRDAHLGDAQPILMGPEGIKPVGEKAESPLRAKFRAAAQRNGHPVALAEAMVSERVEVIQVRDPQGGMHYVKGADYRDAEENAELVDGVQKKDLVQVGPPVVRKAELLTITAEEARKFGFLDRTFSDGEAFPKDEDVLLEELAAEDGRVEKVELSFSESASRTLLKIAGILSAIVALALLVTMWQGVGTMTLVGGIALVLVILINTTADQLHGFPIFLLAVGILLLAAEVFVIPGFGIAGILGVVALGAGFLFLAGGVTLEDQSGLTKDLVVDFGLQFVVTILAGMTLIFTLSRFFPRVGPGRKLMLQAPDGPPVSVATGDAPPARVGQTGVTTSTLRPAGTADIDGRLVDVVTEGEYVDAGRPVTVSAVQGNHVEVRPIAPADGDAV